MAYSPRGQLPVCPTPLLAALALAALTAPPAAAQVFTDTFNTGTDTGWTRNQPLQPLGAPGTWSFPNGNTYRHTYRDPRIRPESSRKYFHAYEGWHRPERPYRRVHHQGFAIEDAGSARDRSFAHCERRD